MKKAGNKNIFRLIRDWGKNSIFMQYFKATFIIILIPLLITETIGFLYVSHNTSNRIQSILNNSFIKDYNTINNTVETVGTQTYLFMNNLHITAMISDDEPKGNYSIQNMMMRNAIKISPYLESIDIYSDISKFVFSTRNSDRIENFDYLPWYDYYLKTGNTNFVVPAKTAEDKKDYDRLSISRGIYYNKKLYGIIVMNIKIDALFKDVLGKNSSEKLFLIDDKGMMLYADNQELINQEAEFSYDFKKDKVMPDVFRCNQKDKIILKRSLETLNATFMAEYDVYSNRSFMPFMIVLSSIIVIMIALFLSAVVEKRRYIPVMEILQDLEEKTKISFGSNAEKRMDEFDYIKDNIRNILDDNDFLKRKYNEYIEELKVSQTRMLQYQLNPHFLFNTLNTINMKAISLTHSENEVSRTIKLLSELLRILLDSEEYFTTVRKEVQIIEKYIEILEIRFNCRFEIKWDISREIMEHKTLSFILQPVIENAVSYGLMKLPENEEKILGISAKKIAGNLIIFISNNGPGDEKIISEVDKQLKAGKMPEKDHIGLKNINCRLKNIFGNEYGCSISRKKDLTVVKIKQPVIQNNEGRR